MTTSLISPNSAVGRGMQAPSGDCIGREDWVTHALCRHGDPDALFVRGAAQRRAAQICEDCPVTSHCLADALDNRIEFGVWGGLTERQRRALLRKHPDVTDWSYHLEHSDVLDGLRN